MAKNMARLEDGVVVNLEWCSDSEPETAELREYEGYAIRKHRGERADHQGLRRLRK